MYRINYKKSKYKVMEGESMLRFRRDLVIM